MSELAPQDVDSPAPEVGAGGGSSIPAGITPGPDSRTTLGSSKCVPLCTPR